MQTRAGVFPSPALYRIGTLSSRQNQHKLLVLVLLTMPEVWIDLKTFFFEGKSYWVYNWGTFIITGLVVLLTC